jgi:hypothetical protein
MKTGLLPTLLTQFGSVIFISAIALAVQLSGFGLLMFPELGALSDDIIKRPYGKWASAPCMLVLTPLITAIAGVWMANHMVFGVYSVLLIIFVSMGVIKLIQSPIAPAISAGLLPLVLGLHSWWYPAAITAGTVALAIVSMVHQQLHPARSPPSLRDMVENTMEKAPTNLLWLLPFLLFVIGITLVAQLPGGRFLLFPPLVVIGFEMFAHPLVCPWAIRPWRMPLACTFCAFIGISAVILLGPGIGAASISMIAGILIMRVINLQAPPVLAIGLLPMIMLNPTYSFVALVLTSTVALTASFSLWQAICLHRMRAR